MLDGEPIADLDIEGLHDHLADCPGCTRWPTRTMRMDRLLRAGIVQDDGHDLAEAVLAEVRLPRRGHRRHCSGSCWPCRSRAGDGPLGFGHIGSP
jgi:hypothetical protein